jgi:hypothetical protein
MLAKALTAGVLTMAFASATLAVRSMHKTPGMETDEAVRALRMCDTEQKRDAAVAAILTGVLRAVEELKACPNQTAADAIQHIQDATR